MRNKEHGFAIVTHGGAGEPLEFTDGCEQAAPRTCCWRAASCSNMHMPTGKIVE